MTLEPPGRLLYLLPYRTRQWRLRRIYPNTYNRLLNLRADRTEDDYSLLGCDRLRCFFVHIPKCAGVSIAKALFGDRGAGHLPAWTFEMAYDKPEFESYYKFAFVRNPWDRVVSAFHFLKEGGMNDHDAAWAQKQGLARMDFEEFVLHRLSSREVLTFYHFHPQHMYLCDGRGRVMVDHLARFERIADEFAAICNRLQVSGTLEHINRTRKREGDYRVCYTETMKGIVADLYRRDIELLRYRFDQEDPA